MKWTNKLENYFRHKRSASSDEPMNTSTQNNHTAMATIPINFNLRMLIVADTHGCLTPEEIPNDIDFDVCLLLGDLSKEDIMIIKEKVVDIPIYGILGNHDGFELYDRCGIENIHGKVVEVNRRKNSWETAASQSNGSEDEKRETCERMRSIRIAGIQGSLRYKYSDMPLYTDEESVEIADLMERADILISHDSPKYLHSTTDFAHSGLEGVGYYCEKHNVALNIHGHHHDNMRKVLENSTMSICCCGVQVIDTRSFN